MSDDGGAVTTVHLLRHGEVFNPDKILYGRLPDFHLSDRGRAQAQTAADWFAAHDPKRLVHLRCSPMDRARETAEPLTALTGLEPRIDERLTEAGNRLEGERIGGRRDVVRLAADPRRLPLFVNPLRPSWGEPYRQIADRVYAAVLSARAAAAELGGDAICVSHQLPIYVVRLFLEGRTLAHSPGKRECALASVTSLQFRGPAASPVVVGLAYAEPSGSTPAGDVPGA